MHRQSWMRTAATSALLLAGLGTLIPSVSISAATPSHAQAASPAVTLQHQIVQLLPKATVRVNLIGGTKSSYAVYVTMTAQSHATLSGGGGAKVLALYLQAYPKQALYALYSYEKSGGVSSLWEYEYVSTNKELRRYHYTFTNPPHTYPWDSWQLSRDGILRAGRAGKWPSNVVVHQPSTSR